MRRIFSAGAVALFLVLCILVSYNDSTIIISGEEPALAACPVEDDFSLSSYKNNHVKVKGIYITGPTAGTERMDEIIQLINDTELNAIVLDVKDDNGNISFKMDNNDAIETGACIPYISDINQLMKKLKDNNIYVIARIPCFKDPTLAAAKPDLALRTLSGDAVTDANGNAWVNPCKEEVWNYIISLAKSCADLGFDEIQLDYVRFPVGVNADMAYYGAPSDDESRQKYINDFISKITDALHEQDIPVTADVFGTIIKSSLDSKHIGQDYKNLASSLDCLCPMIYPSHYASGEFGLETPDANPHDTIYMALDGSKQVLKDIPEDECAVIRPWLQAFTASWVEGYIDYDGAAIRKEIDAVYEAGYDEWILWNSKSNYTSDGLKCQ
ncbi:hypothetical protein SAMN04487830_10829 [Pseudobutyrivibrio sp. OR37]|uniref:putative glycoside hydrolase n=1 Tax=Pseudobutyrivibrio sp. OR37 TaxID=1798186 RepID=UPI0008E8C7E1|nr:putative glycoside hydrolase [Pseudobutyrivibrio sp. OR37]SFH78094.1 hypothetical protein SAMN04487830_10829 [Pseudobutyrivibrio sp. OR37]